jgi:MFS family permease
VAITAVTSESVATTMARRAAVAATEQSHILVLIRLLFLCYYASLGSLMPYLPVYYDSLGHSGPIIGLLGAVKPLTTFLVAPAWGMLSDAVNQPLQILQLTFAVSLLGQLAVAYQSDVGFIMRMVFVTAVFNAPVKSLLDSMVMAVLPESQVADYGRLRLWGQLGFGLGSSGVGMLLSRSVHTVPWPTTSRFTEDFTKRVLVKLPTLVVNVLDFLDKCWQCMSSYRLLFVVHAALSIPTWLCIQAFKRIDRQKKQRLALEKIADGKSASANLTRGRTLDKVSNRKHTQNNGGVMEGLRLLMNDGNALLFFFLIFVTGTSSGLIENFAYVRIREVGGTGQEMGLSRLVSSLAGAPMFWYSGRVSAALGADRVLVLSLLSYVVRFVIYAVMRNAYQGLPAEALRGVTFAAFWSTSTIYAHKVSPPGLQATMLMFLNAMYGGLGQSLGSIIGGKLQGLYGTVLTFWYAAAFDGVFVAFLVLYMYVLRKDAALQFRDPKPIQAHNTAKQR